MKKKMNVLMCIAMICALAAGCGEKEPLQSEPQTELGKEHNTQVQVENKETEQNGKTEADVLLDQFLAGEINADGNDLYFEETFRISDLPIDVEDWESYSVGERLDLDNDGENEQILTGPYGGMYLDASDGKVKVFARGDGTALQLSYTYSEGEYWIVYSDTTHAGRDCYFLEKYSGAEEVVEKVALKALLEEEFASYYVDEQEVSLSIFREELEKYFGTSENVIQYIDWLEDITTEKATDRNSLYEAFLKNEISVENPYVEGDVLSVMSDEDYESEFDGAEKSYAFVDVNGDEQEELIFKISAYPSELIMILSVCNEELICFDVLETHTTSMAFGVYDYGLVWKDENYEHFVRTLYSYTPDGKPELVRTFTEAGSEADMAAHEGEDLDWMPLLAE